MDTSHVQPVERLCEDFARMRALLRRDDEQAQPWHARNLGTARHSCRRVRISMERAAQVGRQGESGRRTASRLLCVDGGRVRGLDGRHDDAQRWYTFFFNEPAQDMPGYTAKFIPFRPATMSNVRRRLFSLIDATPNLDWLLLTKRPEKHREDDASITRRLALMIGSHARPSRCRVRGVGAGRPQSSQVALGGPVGRALQSAPSTTPTPRNGTKSPGSSLSIEGNMLPSNQRISPVL